MSLKKIKIIAAVLCASLALTACSSADGQTGGTGSASKDTSAAESLTSSEASSTSASEDNETDEQETEKTTSKPETEILTDTTTAEPVITVEEAGSVPDSYREYGENGILIIGRNGHYTGLMPCWGTFELCDNYVYCVNQAAKMLPDVNVYSMVIPTSVEFYTPSDVTGFTASQKEKIDYIAEGLSGVTNVDAYSAVAAHQDEYIFSRTDHHWQPLGAYYAAQVFANTAGVGDLFAPLSEYTAVTSEGYMGSFYTYSQSANLYSDPELFTMYISPNDENLTTTYYDTYFQNGYEGDLFVSRSASAYYVSFLGSDQLIAEIKTDCTNGKTLVVFKESYGNALIPFLTQCYEAIYVCDIRYFDLNAIDFCKEVGATDLLFATGTQTPAGTNCSYFNTIIFDN